MATTYKVCVCDGLTTDIEDTICFRPNGDTYDDFMEEILIRMPELRTETLRVFYQDRQSDIVTICNETDFKMLKEFNITKLYVKPRISGLLNGSKLSVSPGKSASTNVETTPSTLHDSSSSAEVSNASRNRNITTTIDYSGLNFLDRFEHRLSNATTSPTATTYQHDQFRFADSLFNPASAQAGEDDSPNSYPSFNTAYQEADYLSSKLINEMASMDFNNMGQEVPLATLASGTDVSMSFKQNPSISGSFFSTASASALPSATPNQTNATSTNAPSNIQPDKVFPLNQWFLPLVTKPSN